MCWRVHVRSHASPGKDCGLNPDLCEDVLKACSVVLHKYRRFCSLFNVFNVFVHCLTFLTFNDIIF